ncbi:MAG: hypothetical protein ABMB14_37050, partial [Myxococcota bacterium]
MWIALMAACDGPSDVAVDEPQDIVWGDPVTTLTRRIEPAPPIEPPLTANPSFADGLAEAEAAGLGGWSDAPGDPFVLREDLAPRGAQPDRRSLAFVFHQSDAQLADTESPTRLAAADAPGTTQSAARPQELFAIHALDALLRAANAVSVDHPIDFGIVSGDNADSAQQNETDWFVSVWDGRTVHPDAGGDDAQPDDAVTVGVDDPIEAFDPEGAAFPWYTIAGNHDVLVQGNFGIGSFEDTALGAAAAGGTRDLSQPGGPLAFSTVADPGRVLLDRGELAQRYLASTSDPPGHGFTGDGTVTWTASPLAGLRLIGVDCNPSGIGDGELPAAQRDGFLIPALDAARDAGELVIVTSHYALGGRGIEGGGTVDALLAGWPNVVLSVVGHSHTNRIRPWGTFWEIETSSSVDWPGQGRLIELVDNGDGTLSIYATLLDPLVPDGTLVARWRTLALIDWQSGWLDSDGTGA